VRAEDVPLFEDLLERALALPAAERDALLERECAGRPDLRAAVEELLLAATRDGGRLDALADEVARDGPLEIEARAHREQRIGPYRLLGLLGRGGMGSVFLAERVDGGFAQRVAIKLVAFGADTPETLARFTAERKILAELEHPGIARLLDGGTTEDGRPYLVLEYVDGEPLTAYCDRVRAPLEQRIRLLLEVAEAVRFAHSRLVVHRDLKPSNLWIGADGHPKLLDFGIAKLLVAEDGGALTRSTDRPGTLLYAAPEQLTGTPITTATDVYGLGAVLFELLAGRRPFEPVPDGRALELRILEEEPERPSRIVAGDWRAAEKRATTAPALARALEGDLDTICAKALEKDPARRYGSVAELAADLERHLEGRPVSARPATLGYRLGKYVRRHRWGAASAAAALLASAGFVATLAVQAAELRRERDRAQRIAGFFTGLFELADPSEARGASVTVREVLDRGAGALLAGPADAPAVQLDLLETVADLHRSLGLYERATPFAERLLALRSAEVRPEPAALVAARVRLGELFRLRGDYPRSREQLDAAVALATERLPLDEPRRGNALRSSGRTRFAQGDLDGAERHLRDAIASHEAAGGSTDPAAAEDRVALAAVLAARGDFAGAEPLLREALEAQRAAFGDDHPALATTANDLATVLARKGDLAAAIPVATEAVEIQKRVLGPLHPRVATALNNLGTMRLSRGEYRAAEPLLAESLAIRRQALDPKHPELAQSLANLGLLLQIVGRFEESAALQAEALSIRTAALGPRHVLVGQGIHNRGLLEQARGDLAGAERSLRESLALLTELLPEKHPLLAINLHNLGALLHERGRLAEAETWYRRGLEMRRALAPGGHPDVAYSLVGLARLLAETGRADEGETLAREAVERRAKTHAAGSFERAEAGAVLGEARIARGDVAGGEPLLRAALADLDAMAEPRHDALALHRRIARRLAAPAGAR
jgi:serine/threonine-protein kinase